MKISETEKRLISLVEFNANESFSNLDRHLGIKIGSAQGMLRSLIDRGVLHYYPLINPFVLGFINGAFILSLAPESIHRSEDLISYLKVQPEVAWLCELGGVQQLALNVLTHNQTEMGSFFAKVNHLFPFISVGRRFALQQSLTMLGTRYLYPVGLIPVPVQLANTGARVEIDEIDRKILQGILTLEHRSGRDLGNQLGLPSTTFNNRLKALEQKQVIARHLYLVNPAALGWQAFKLVIVLRGTTESLREDLVRFCQRKENVTVLIQVIGSWDFELSLEVPELSVANQIARELQVAFSSAIASLELLPQGVEHRVSNFPVVGLSNPLRDEKSASVYG